MEKTVLFDIRQSIATITLNRPSAMNAINQEFVSDFTDTLNSISHNHDVRVVVLTGAGKAFCAGGDIGYLSQLTNPAEARKFIADVGQLTAAIMKMDKPFIAMVNGVAAGAGFNLALACDLVVCAKSARLAQSFAKVGLVSDCGGMYLLPRIVGLHKAKELMFTADMLDADTALQLQLVNRVADDERLRDTAYQLAERLSGAAPVAISLMKRTINRSQHLDLETVLEFEADLQALCMQTADYREGITAFKEKRAPHFTGQ